MNTCPKCGEETDRQGWCDNCRHNAEQEHWQAQWEAEQEEYNRLDSE